ncbi:hypothetical protein [Paraflavitalea pollutisoli]|uniref:hypothetical protein n=1 Tax=Paraflavitalea pollutisoli TaxID=3034143 RepID=UPI0023EA9E48|nr:hypothetical protein [Paraflavitalea sp. H1-2-19X]
MDKQLRNEAIKTLIGTGKIKEFRDIFKKYGYPKSLLVTKGGFANETVNKALENPDMLRISQVKLIAKHFNVPTFTILDLILTQTGEDWGK